MFGWWIKKVPKSGRTADNEPDAIEHFAAQPDRC